MTNAARSRLKLYRWGKLDELPSPTWLIKGVLPKRGLSLLIGKSGSMKTFVAIDVLASVGRGCEWCGKSVKQGAVLFIAAEGGRSVVRRFQAYARHHAVNVADVPVYLLPEAVDFWSPDTDVDVVIERINDLYQDRFSFIVVDTLNAAMLGGDENTPKDMGLVLQNCNRLRRATGAHVMLVHHLGKDSAKGARGHSSLKAAVDTEIEVELLGDTVSVTISKQRDGITGERYCLDREFVDLGRDEDGDEIMSCVLVRGRKAAKADTTKRKTTHALPAGCRIALDALRDALKSDGTKPPESGDIPAEIEAVVTIAIWRSRAYALGVSRGEERAKQKAFERALETLKKKGLICVADDFAWLSKAD